jgi:hypothetical protein
MDIGLDVFLEMKTASSRTRVRLWKNHVTEPDVITIVAGDEDA